jgi:hypothetical protein
LGDIRIGEIKSSVTGKYILDERIGGNVCDVDINPFSGNINVTTARDYRDNEEKGATITPNPFANHGQDSENWSRSIWEAGDETTPKTSKSTEQVETHTDRNSSYSSSNDRFSASQHPSGINNIKSYSKSKPNVSASDSLFRVYCPHGVNCIGSTKYSIPECYLQKTENSRPLFLLDKGTSNMGFWGTIAVGGLSVYSEHVKEKAGVKETYEIYRCPKCKARVVFKKCVEHGVTVCKKVGDDLAQENSHAIAQKTSQSGVNILKTCGLLALGALFVGGVLAQKDEMKSEQKE